MIKISLNISPSQHQQWAADYTRPEWCNMVKNPTLSRLVVSSQTEKIYT